MTPVSLDQLLRYTLDRQGLLARQPLSELAGMGPLHATDHTTPYLSALARADFTRWEEFADLYYDHHAYTRLRCMRGTLHLIPEEQVEAVQCVYRINEEEPFPEFEEYSISLDDATRLRFAIMETLEREGSQSSTSIKHYISPALIKSHTNRYGGETTTIGPVMRWLWSLGLIEAGRGVKNWRHKDNHFRIAENPPHLCDLAQADEALCRWYFSLYAPASYEDWAWWTGLKSDRNKAAFAALQSELGEVKVNGIAETLWMLHKDIPMLTQTEDRLPEMTRLLPYEDAIIKAYKATRYRFFDPQGLAADIAITKGGEALPTVWLNGRIIGIWSWTKKPKHPLMIEPFQQLTRNTHKLFKAETERVRAFIEANEILWNF